MNSPDPYLDARRLYFLSNAVPAIAAHLGITLDTEGNPTETDGPGTSRERSAHDAAGGADAGLRGALVELADRWGPYKPASDLRAVLGAHPAPETGMATLAIPPDGMKMLRETLARAQAALARRPMSSSVRADIDRLGDLIRQCDVHRPLGSDGKHGDRHTSTCGCKDLQASSISPAPGPDSGRPA
ncbi:MAG: hypothetical protein K0R97_2859 [Oerskovia sp.]|jgi:hypothetical protein|nr:hypothetical protein [Oerskovia sp.]